MHFEKLSLRIEFNDSWISGYQQKIYIINIEYISSVRRQRTPIAVRIQHPGDMTSGNIIDGRLADAWLHVLYITL